MTTRHLATAVAWGSILILAIPASPGARASDFQFGGPRKPKVSVEEDGDDYVVRVRFLPVSGFDPATNARLNRGKGRDYALRGLAAHASGGRSPRLALSGGEITKSGIDGTVFRLTFRVSKGDVDAGGIAEEVESASHAIATEKRGKASSFPARSALFTRKDDFLDTLDRLRAHYISEAERASVVLTDAEYATRVREIRDEVGRDLNRFIAEVEEDKLLDFVERDGISARVARDREDIHARLRLPEAHRKRERRSEDHS